MKVMTKRFLLAFCALLCLATAGFCVDPFMANEGGFGPKIKGFQLGMAVNRNNAEEFGLTYKGTYDRQESYEYQGGFVHGGADINVKSGRVAEMRFNKEIFNAGDMSAHELAQAVMKAYHIPNMEGNKFNNTYKYRNASDGWQISVFDDGYNYGEVKVTPVVVGDTAFD